MDIATLNCPRCQTEMFEGAHFCVRCGCRLDERPPAPSKVSGAKSPGAYSELLAAPGRPSAAPIRAESVSEALSKAGAQVDRALEEAAAAAGAVVRHDDMAASLRDIDADFGAIAPTEAAMPAVTAPAPLPSPEATAPDQEDEGSSWRQSTMAEHSRDEVLRRARLKQSLKRAGLAGIDLSGAILEGMDFARADLEGANLENAKLRGASFKSANLRNAKLNGADLAQADLDKADLEDAELERASLEGANLKRATLDGASLDGANLSGAQLIGAELAAASLAGAVLRGADLAGAELAEAELGMADLSGANLSGANFQGATLDGAILHGARVAGAIFAEVTFAGTLIDWVDASALGDGSLRMEGPRALAFLRGEVQPEDTRSTRYFGKGDVLRDATLEFGENSRIHVDSRFDNCSITLREGAELTIGEAGVLKNCAIVGAGKVIVHGRFFERQTPGIVGVRSLFVSSRGGLVGGVEQVGDGTQFAFEPGCRLRMKILRPRLADAAE